MKHHSCVQGSEQWLRLRMGKPTASEFGRILTPKNLERSASARIYAIDLLTELMLDCPLSGVTTAAMEHGHDWEAKAILAYEMLNGVDVEPCGFITNDEETIGASPDSLVGPDGSLEIKCPAKPEIHVKYLVDPISLIKEYGLQVQGQLFVTGRKWTDLVSYFMGLPMQCIRIYPDPKVQDALSRELDIFVRDLSTLIDMARERQWFRESDGPKPVDHSKDWITDEDVEAAIANARKNIAQEVSQ